MLRCRRGSTGPFVKLQRLWRTASPGIVVVALLIVPPPAGAHLRSGTVAVDYRASVSSPRASAYSAQVFQSDRALGVTIKPGHVVVLVGYLGEPVFRLDAAGLWVNVASPTAVVLRLVKKSARIVAVSPRWRLAQGRRSVVWQDSRAQGLPPGVRRGDWSVPLIVDGQRSAMRGELHRLPAPALWPWLAVAAAAAAALLIVAFALDAYASPGTWIEGLDALAFLGVGIWVLFRGPERWRIAGAIGTGLVALAVGLLDGAVFLHPIVLAILPAGVVKLTGLVAIGAGLDAAALGALFYAETHMPGTASGSSRRAHSVTPCPRCDPDQTLTAHRERT